MFGIRERFGIVGEILFWVLAALAIGILVAVIIAAVQGPINTIEYGATKHQQNYVDAQNTAAREAMNTYKKLEAKAKAETDKDVVKSYKAQMATALDEVDQHAHQLSAFEVSDDIAQFLADHPIGGQ